MAAQRVFGIALGYEEPDRSLSPAPLRVVVSRGWWKLVEAA
jgi:hypothetical protein